MMEIYKGRKLTPDEYGFLLSLPVYEREIQYKNLQIFGEFK